MSSFISISLSLQPFPFFLLPWITSIQDPPPTGFLYPWRGTPNTQWKTRLPQQRSPKKLGRLLPQLQQSWAPGRFQQPLRKFQRPRCLGQLTNWSPPLAKDLLIFLTPPNAMHRRGGNRLPSESNSGRVAIPTNLTNTSMCPNWRFSTYSTSQKKSRESTETNPGTLRPQQNPTEEYDQNRQSKYVQYFQSNKILPILEYVQEMELSTLSLIKTDLRTRKLAGLMREEFEEQLKTTGIPSRYFCRAEVFRYGTFFYKQKKKRRTILSTNSLKYNPGSRASEEWSNVPVFLPYYVLASFLNA